MSQSTVDETEDEASSPSQPQLQQQVVEMMMDVNQMKQKLDTLQQKQINKFDQLQRQVNKNTIQQEQFIWLTIIGNNCSL